MVALVTSLGRVGGLRGELLAEFLGVFVLIAFGDGVVAMAVAALPGSGRAATPTTIFLAAGDWLLIAWGWALAVAMAIWVAGGVTGAHINPAVTLSFAVRRKFPWMKVVPYWTAQVAGAFAGAALVFWVPHPDHCRDHRQQEPDSRRQHGAAGHRLGRGGGRHVLRCERWLRDQPGT